MTLPDAPATDPKSVPLEVTCFPGGAFAENTYLLRCTKTNRAAAVDPGAATPRLIQALDRTGATLDDVFLTHAHIDHVEGIPILMERKPVPVWLHPSDLPIYEWSEKRARDFGINLPGPLPRPDHDLEPGDSITVGEQSVEVRFAPGHAPGHVIFYFAPGHLALVGDVIFNKSIGRTDLPFGDTQQLFRSIRAEVMTLPDSTRLLTGHGAETTVAEERLGNPFLISQAAGRFA